MATTESIEAAPSHLDPQGRLAAEVPCIGCAYNLRLQPADGLCPECGHAVAPSMERWLNPLPGLKRARVGAVVGGVVAVAGALVQGFGLLMAMLQPEGVMREILVYPLVFLVLPVSGFVATWLILTPAIRSGRHGAPRIWAWVGRLSPIVLWYLSYQVGMMVQLGVNVILGSPRIYSTADWRHFAAMAASGISQILLTIPGAWGSSLPIIWLARRLQSERLARMGMIILLAQLLGALAQIVFLLIRTVNASGNAMGADGWVTWGVALPVYLLFELVRGLWLFRLSRVIRDALPRGSA